jgi:hypothetical protein
MGQDRRRGIRLILEEFERRELPSGIIDVMASQSPVIHPAHASSAALVQSSQATPSLSNPNVPPPIGPGPGIPSARELAREHFKAFFSGPFYAAPPRFSGQSKIFFFRGLGGSTQFLHGDYQMQIVIPADPTSAVVGAAYLQDRNINSGGAVGFDVTTTVQSLDQFGRPTQLTFTQDPNIYSGVDFVDTASGTLTIRYTSTGSATAVFQGLLYTNSITDPLRNMDLQARGGRLTARS